MINPGFAQLIEQPGNHRNALQRVILTLQGHEKVIGRGESVQGEDPEGGRTIDEDELKAIAVPDGVQGEFDALNVVFEPGDLDVGPAKVDLAGDNLQAIVAGFLNAFLEGSFSQEHPVGAGAFHLFQSQPAGGIGLRIQVKQEDPPPRGCQAGGNIDGTRGFSDPALLVGHGYDSRRHRPIKRNGSVDSKESSCRQFIRRVSCGAT
jgi:hypothetical protein